MHIYQRAHGVFVVYDLLALLDIQVLAVELPRERVAIIQMKGTPIDLYFLPDN